VGVGIPVWTACLSLGWWPGVPAAQFDMLPRFFFNPCTQRRPTAQFDMHTHQMDMGMHDAACAGGAIARLSLPRALLFCFILPLLIVQHVADARGHG
jgi:hypothetical protein